MPSYQEEALSLFVQRQLLDQSRRVYEAPLPPLHAFELFPDQGAVRLGAANYNRRIYRYFGRSQWASNSGDDLPLSGAGVIEDIYNVGMHGVAYQYGLQEIRAAQFANENLEDRRAMAARRAILEFNNDVAFYGSVAKGITGLLSIPYIPRVSVDAALFQVGADPDATLAALYALENGVEELSLQAEKPDTLIMGTSQYNYIANTRVSDLSEVTILEVYKRNAQFAKTVKKARELDNAGPSGEDMICCVSTADDKLEHNLPDPLTILEPQQRNLLTVVPMVSETAGMISEYPYAHRFAEVG